MNAFMKAALKEAYDIEQVGVAVVKKTPFVGLIPLLIVAGEDAVAVSANIGDAGAEFKALVADPASDADLIAYGLSLGWTSNAKVTLIIGDCAALGLANVQAISKLVADLKT